VAGYSFPFGATISHSGQTGNGGEVVTITFIIVIITIFIIV